MSAWIGNFGANRAVIFKTKARILHGTGEKHQVRHQRCNGTDCKIYCSSSNLCLFQFKFVQSLLQNFNHIPKFQIFQANECSECFTRCCYGSNRPFNMKVFDFPLQREVMHFKRPCTFSGFCGPHFPESLKVSAVGQMFGRIEEDLDYPQFVVKNLFDEIVLRIEGPSCKHPTGGNVEFQVNISDIRIFFRRLSF